MYKSDKELFIELIDKLNGDYNFNGLLHFTDFSNLDSIFNTGYLKSRYECEEEEVEYLDVANQEVIQNTQENVKKCVRFYYKEKTPTLYRNEGIKINNEEPHIPIPVYLLFDSKLVYSKSSVFADGNAGSSYTHFDRSSNFFANMDWETIFSRGPIPYHMPEHARYEEKRKRQAELLYTNPVSLDYLKKIIFRCEADKKRALNLFTNNELYIVESSLFNNHRNYLVDYSMELNSNNLNLKLTFNKNNYKRYNHRYKIIDINNDECFRDREININDSATGLTISGSINNLSNIQNIKFEYYMNEILCIEEFIN